ncbi:MAG TPA: spondin domain-containing protein [Sphingomicrobium sp.]
MKIPGKILVTMAASLALAGVASAESVKHDHSFTILVNNVSTENTLRLPDDTTANVPVAPGAYAVVRNGAHIFHPSGKAEAALERLAEDGQPEAFVAQLKKMKGVRAVGILMPNEPFNVTVRPGERLVFAAMFARSNDLFYAPDPDGIDLFDGGGEPKFGILSDSVTLWDAGTEVNEAPGAGANQPANQAKPNTGPDEHNVIRPVNDGFTYPAARDVLEVSVTAN